MDDNNGLGENHLKKRQIAKESVREAGELRPGKGQRLKYGKFVEKCRRSLKRTVFHENVPANYEVLGSGNPQVGQILHCLLSITNHCLFSDAINKQLAYLELSQAVVGVPEELGGEADDLLLSHLLVLLDDDRQSLQLHLALVDISVTKISFYGY